MDRLKQHIKNAFDILCQISVKDMDVDRMTAAKQILKSVYAELEKYDNEGSDG